MDKESGGGFGWILAAVGMGLCCALPVLLVSGSLGAAAAWLFDEGLVWLAAALALLAGGVLLRFRRRGARAGRSGNQFTGEVRDRAANADEDPRAVRAPDAPE